MKVNEMLELFNKLDESLSKYNRVILMTHARPDLDGFGSAVALYEYLKGDKEVIFVKPKLFTNNSLKRALDFYNKDIPYMDEEELLKSDLSDALLIILDTNSLKVVESKDLALKAKNIIVIDHHCLLNNLIEPTELDIRIKEKSSTIEIVTEFLKNKNFKLDKNVLTMLLAGLEVDTNTYNLKTTEETFKIAGYLVGQGADLILKQEILKEPKDEEIRRYELLKNSYEVTDGRYICVMDDEIYGPVDMSLVAQNLLKFAGVKVAFAIGKLSDDTIGISARSMGDINVGEMMNRLGGGGHLANAACQIKGKNIQEVRESLEEVIKEE